MHSLPMELSGQIGMRTVLVIIMATFHGLTETQIGQANTTNMLETKTHVLLYLAILGRTIY